MYSQKLFQLGDQASPIRELFNYGQEQAKLLGPDKVFDFTIGNPSIPLPDVLTEALQEIIREYDPVALHSYSVSAGHPSARKAVADNLNERFGTQYGPQNLYFTCGAAAALCATFAALTYDANSEFIALAPYFPEYRNFVETKGGKFVAVPNAPDFRLNLEGLEAAINPHTQAVIVNSPNNPSGKIYSEEEIKDLAALLERKSKEYHKPIYIVTDEPYRELVYGGLQVAFIPNYYRDTIVCYSYSKLYSLPGERIGYVLVPAELTDSDAIYKAIAGAARTQGYVCAPVLFQRLIERYPNFPVDFSLYEQNREKLSTGLREIGYECVEPEGAFYLFLKAPSADGSEFSQLAKEKNVLLVPGVGFGCPDYVRVSYCVPAERIERAMPLFAELYQASK